MKTTNYFTKSKVLLFAMTFILYSCSNDPITISENSSISLSEINSKMTIKKHTDTSKKLHFTTTLKANNETSPNDSKAVGQAIVDINKEENMIHYKLIVANIENVTMSHFHLGEAGTNGGIVVWLYDNRNGQPSGVSNGVLAEGDIIESDITGNLSTMSELIEAIRTGLIYVNVHTQQIGSGEIRGQL
ncbi:CHRD domain-containing protein [Aestuariibaculum suncheonense]|uniref:CHRD domain-containing protein n=1 Tax=Aestuariibaculum suncheonense TaxID=1028745 RepID=A0A8J6QH11_9FLAO|nr:CHRD domain-containing protein [Aestuariibaculum suncheonense]MBD0836345.1 CHRD domain-containing protein [Aestuariibaculum suncheonense]